MVDEMWRCKDHGKHCKGIQYLEKGQEKLERKVGDIDKEIVTCSTDKTTEIKDARKSLAEDIKTLKDDFVRKEVFEAKMRISNLLTGAILLLLLKDYLL